VRFLAGAVVLAMGLFLGLWVATVATPMPTGPRPNPTLTPPP